MSDKIFEASRRFYDNDRTVTTYSEGAALQPAELAILKAMSPRLSGMDMLDLGVGAGRTAKWFAPLVRRYAGSDFSPLMISECRRKFPELDFFVADASDLSALSDASFDFILFSFNGLDCMYSESRARALAEFWRVLRPGGVLAFSSHNLQSIPLSRSVTLLFASVFSRDGLAAMKNLLRFAFRTRSVKMAQDGKTAIVVERHLGHDIPIFFIRPDHQISLLASAGWSDICAFPGDSGSKIPRNGNFAELVDPWIYYMCSKAT